MTPQTPPTDRPLTAGDAKLEDVLFFKLKDLILEQSEGEWDDSMIVRDAHHFASNLRPLFARPATSAASDEGVSLRVAFDPFVEGGKRYEAALASPPVSERGRELEGALRALSKYVCHDDDCQLVLQAGPIPPRRCTCGLERARALTAQPAGEGL